MSRFLLAPYVRVGFLDGVLHFGFGSLRQLIEDKKLQSCLLDSANFLLKPQYLNDVSLFLLDLGYDLQTIECAFEILKKNFILPEGIYSSFDRHSRSLLFYALSSAEIHSIQKCISKKKIAIVGCGGIGNVVSVLLATAGVEEFLLMDGDLIEISNLSRQVMFEEKDCGKYKTTILGEALKSRCSTVKIIEIKEFITNKNTFILKDYDFILISGDQNNVLNVINSFAVKNNVPFMNVGYVEDIAVYGPLVIPGKSGCYDCKQHLVNFDNLTQDQIDKCKKINAAYQAPSIGPINMMAASLASLDILRFLGDFGEIQSLNTRIGLWSHDLHIEKQNYQLNPECKTCGSLQKLDL